MQYWLLNRLAQRYLVRRGGQQAAVGIPGPDLVETSAWELQQAAKADRYHLIASSVPRFGLAPRGRSVIYDDIAADDAGSWAIEAVGDDSEYCFLASAADPQLVLGVVTDDAEPTGFRLGLQRPPRSRGDVAADRRVCCRRPIDSPAIRHTSWYLTVLQRGLSGSHSPGNVLLHLRVWGECTRSQPIWLRRRATPRRRNRLGHLLGLASNDRRRTLPAWFVGDGCRRSSRGGGHQLQRRGFRQLGTSYPSTGPHKGVNGSDLCSLPTPWTGTPSSLPTSASVTNPG